MLNAEQGQRARQGRAVPMESGLKGIWRFIALTIALLLLYCGITYLPGGLGLSFSVTVRFILSLHIFNLFLALIAFLFNMRKTIRKIKGWITLDKRRQQVARAYLSNDIVKRVYTQTYLPAFYSIAIPEQQPEQPKKEASWLQTLLASKFGTLLVSLVGICLIFSSEYHSWSSNFSAGLPHDMPTLISFFFGLAIDTAFCLLCLIVFVSLLFQRPDNRATLHQLTATENGLIEQRGKVTELIPWSEVRLFALIKSEEKEGEGINYTYELASSKILIRWSTQFIQPPQQRAGTIQEHYVSVQTYQQQTQTLLTIIATRTGLPLYDLREIKP